MGRSNVRFEQCPVADTEYEDWVWYAHLRRRRTLRGPAARELPDIRIRSTPAEFIRRQELTHRGNSHRIRITPATEKEILVFHVRESFRIKCHSHKMQARIKAVYLHRSIDVVPCQSIRF